jgi:hypothetical protein
MIKSDTDITMGLPHLPSGSEIAISFKGKGHLTIAPPNQETIEKDPEIEKWRKLATFLYQTLESIEDIPIPVDPTKNDLNSLKLAISHYTQLRHQLARYENHKFQFKTIDYDQDKSF